MAPRENTTKIYELVFSIFVIIALLVFVYLVEYKPRADKASKPPAPVVQAPSSGFTVPPPPY